MNSPCFVVEHGARANRAGARIELVVDEIDVPWMRKAVFVGEADVDRIRRVARTRARAGARHRVVSEICVLVAVEVHVDRIDGDDRRQQRAAAVAAGDEIAARHFRARPTRPSTGARTSVNDNINSAEVERRARRSEVRLLLIALAQARVELLRAESRRMSFSSRARFASRSASSSCDLRELDAGACAIVGRPDRVADRS